MPTYEYQCLKCGYKFDWFQEMTEEPLKRCSRCGGKLERMIGPGAGIIFKGSGFYATDYAKKPKKEETRSSKETKSNNKPKPSLTDSK
jgi:putative FmdB family regulatory protein